MHASIVAVEPFVSQPRAAVKLLRLAALVLVIPGDDGRAARGHSLHTLHIHCTLPIPTAATFLLSTLQVDHQLDPTSPPPSLRHHFSFHHNSHFTTTSMPVPLDPACFPHIAEAILSNVTDRGMLLAARLVSSSMLSLVDPLLCSKRLHIEPDSRGNFSAVTSNLNIIADRLTVGTVPYLIKSGNAATQAAALRQLDTLTLHTHLVTHHVNGLLQHLSPAAYVEIEHVKMDGRGRVHPAEFHGTLSLPTCDSLMIAFHPSCTCGSAGNFEHGTTGMVHLLIFPEAPDSASRARHSTCAFIAGAINPSVTVLLVNGDILQLPVLLAAVHVRSNPNLKVIFEPIDYEPTFDQEIELVSKTADCLGISEAQITF